MTLNSTKKVSDVMIIVESTRQVASMLQQGLVNIAATYLYNLRLECSFTYDQVLLRLPSYIHEKDIQNVVELVDTLVE